MKRTRKKRGAGGPFGGIGGEGVLLDREIGWLLVLSATDIFLTHALLRQGQRFYESNPVADWFFQRYNIAGLVAYKFLIISVVIVICEFVERRRPGLGRRVLQIGIVAAGGVVVYSLSLIVRHVF
ncbi:hypothetical protein BH23PLA1_BH23PLA1_28540 [soil metagenome]